jgi:hypothetical protein
MKNKRLIFCTIGGLLAAVICSIGGYFSGNITEFSYSAIAGVFFNRIMLGFSIGVSRLKIHYLSHGMLLGFLVSCITSISFLGDNFRGFVFFTGAGILYGLLIELFVTKVFKAELKVLE